MRATTVSVSLLLASVATIAPADTTFERGRVGAPFTTHECDCEPNIEGLGGEMNEFHHDLSAYEAHSDGAWGGYYDGSQNPACTGGQITPNGMIDHEYVAVGDGGVLNPYLFIEFEGQVDVGGSCAQLNAVDPQWWWNAVIKAQTGQIAVFALHDSGWLPYPTYWYFNSPGYAERGCSGGTWTNSSSNAGGGAAGVAFASGNIQRINPRLPLLLTQGPSNADNVAVGFHYAKLFIAFSTQMPVPE